MNVFKQCRIFLLLLPLISFISCKDDDDDIIWDIAPVEAHIFIQDADGNNLLSPGVEGSLFGDNICAIYNGETYETQWNYRPNNSRYYLAIFNGLQFRKGFSVTDGTAIDNPSLDRLIFGEFPGDEDQDISFDIKVKDYPEIYHIRILHDFKWENHKPKSTRRTYLNDKLIESGPIVIKLPAKD